MSFNRSRIVRTTELTAVCLVAWAAALSGCSDSSGDSAEPLYTVRRGPLTVSISETGAMRSGDQVIVKSQVPGRATILWIIEEGTPVKADDLLVVLDDSDFQDRKVDQEIRSQNADAGYIRAFENLAVVKNQALSDNAQAELKLMFAQQDLDKYIKGEYPQQLEEAEKDVTISEEELTRAQDQLAGSEKLYANGYITESELEADKLALKKRRLELGVAKRKLEVLTSYTHQRQLAQLNSDLEQATAELERVKRRANADVVQAEADLRAKKAENERQADKLKKVVESIANCRIKAPADGMVVYATSVGQGHRRRTEPLAEGQEVHERQDLIYLPTSSDMVADIKVHESALHKIRVGLPARITSDALPGEVYRGAVSKIGVMADSQDWFRSDVKVYTTEVKIDGEHDELRPGMTCRAEIVVETHDDVLYVPVQSVLRVNGRPTVYVMNGDDPEARTVSIGLDNNRMMHILDGLAVGDRVMLAPPLSPSEQNELAASEESDDTSAAATESTKPDADVSKPDQPPPPAAPSQTGAAQPTTDDSAPAATAETPSEDRPRRGMGQMSDADLRRMLSTASQSGRLGEMGLPAAAIEDIKQALGQPGDTLAIKDTTRRAIRSAFRRASQQRQREALQQSESHV